MPAVKQQHGFTLIELVFALMLGSAIIVVMSTGIIKLFQIYQAGISIRNSQQTARILSDEITRDARGHYGAGASSSSLCLMDPADLASGKANGIAYFLDGGSLKKVNLTGVTRSANGSYPCNPSAAGAVTVSPENTVVLAFSATSSPVISPNLVSYQLTVVGAGVSDLVNNATNPPTCKAVVGSQYCSITTFRTTTGLLEPQ